MRFNHQHRTLKADPLAFVPNQTRKVSLRVGEFFTETILHFTIAITAGATAPVGNLKYGGLFNIMRQIRMTLNNTDTFLRLSGAGLRTVIVQDQNRLPTGLVNPPLVAAGETETVNFTAIISHTLERTDDYYMTGLDARNVRRVKDVDLEIDWGSVADLYDTPNGATMAVIVDVEQGFIDNFIVPKVPVNEWKRGADGKIARDSRGRPISTGRMKQRAINPAIREFDERTIEVAGSKPDYLVAEVEKSNAWNELRSITVIGLISGAANSGVFDGDYMVTQGTETLSKAKISGLVERVKNWREGFGVGGVVEMPFGYKSETTGYQNTARYKDDLEVRMGLRDFASIFGPTSALVITEQIRQEVTYR